MLGPAVEKLGGARIPLSAAVVGNVLAFAYCRTVSPMASHTLRGKLQVLSANADPRPAESRELLHEKNAATVMFNQAQQGRLAMLEIKTWPDRFIVWHTV